mmetsp:Transcript_5440/g.23025  ORF Transcript_5440/g.23025 Transcript_5440/m.23025 type:complete len:211 (-) Transcript_5440:2662-3294(-)
MYGASRRTCRFFPTSGRLRVDVSPTPSLARGPSPPRGRLAWGASYLPTRSIRRTRGTGTWISSARIRLRTTPPRASVDDGDDGGTRSSRRSSPSTQKRASPTRSAFTPPPSLRARPRTRATSWRASSARQRTSRRSCGTGGSSATSAATASRTSAASTRIARTASTPTPSSPRSTSSAPSLNGDSTSRAWTPTRRRCERWKCSASTSRSG